MQGKENLAWLIECMIGPVNAEPQDEKQSRDGDDTNDRWRGHHAFHDRTERTPTLAYETLERGECHSRAAPLSSARMFGSQSLGPQRHRFTIPETKSDGSPGFFLLEREDSDIFNLAAGFHSLALSGLARLAVGMMTRESW